MSRDEKPHFNRIILQVGDADTEKGGTCMNEPEPDTDRHPKKRVNDGIRHIFLGAALVAAAAVFVAQVATAQSSAAIHGNHPIEASGLTTHAAADLPLTIHVSFAIRYRAALNKLLTELQDPASPNYHKWLTPAEFDGRFGRTPSEVHAVNQWLTSQGFHVVRSSARNLTASATVSQAESAFATTIAASSDGSTYGNLSDPQIPAPLVGVIGSIEGLDNTLHSQPLTSRPSDGQQKPARVAPHGAVNALKPAMAKSAASSGLAAVAPGYSGGSGTAFGPSDLYTFYNETPLLNGGTNGGSGDCVALAEDSDFSSNSVTLFDSNFSLTPANITRVFPDGASPGINGDEIEVLLDIEWAHAVAPGAPINVYIGTSLQDAITAPVADNKCGAISISYAFCGGSSSFYTSTLDSAFAQAAAQGQSIFVSSGDWGAAGLVVNGGACAVGTTRNVNEMSADPNVTSVGGSQFHPVYNGAGNDVGSVAESTWNDPAGAGGGGKSQYFAKPSYQNSVTPNDGGRDVPDVAYVASPYYPGFYWGDDVSGTAVMNCCIGGTSLSAPLWAGLAKLIAQKNGARLGNMNPKIYQLGALNNPSQSGLRDVTSGNNNWKGVTGFSAVTGYDQVTGWGTADMATFAAAFAGTSPTPTPTPTGTPTPTPTPTPKPTPTPTPRPTPTPTPKPTPTPTPKPSATPTPRHGHH